LSRSAAPGQTVPPALVAKLFTAKPGDVVTASDETGAYTAQLKEIQSPETISDAAAAGLSDQLASEARVGIAGELTEALRRRFPVEIQREALDRMF
jgi:peptidyl-prolyl cis-trans isomerase D